jgi:hypothetical protein
MTLTSRVQHTGVKYTRITSSQGWRSHRKAGMRLDCEVFPSPAPQIKLRRQIPEFFILPGFALVRNRSSIRRKENVEISMI